MIYRRARLPQNTLDGRLLAPNYMSRIKYDSAPLLHYGVAFTLEQARNCAKKHGLDVGRPINSVKKWFQEETGCKINGEMCIGDDGRFVRVYAIYTNYSVTFSRYHEDDERDAIQLMKTELGLPADQEAKWYWDTVYEET